MGSPCNNNIFGNTGNDAIIGNGGADNMTGGRGNDVIDASQNDYAPDRKDSIIGDQGLSATRK